MKVYRLMHQEKIVAVITFNGDTPVNLSVINAAYMPIGTVFQYKNVYKCTITKFKHWWENRIIPNSRSGIQQILKKSNVKTVGTYALQNLGLSLTDSYWLCPVDTPLTWKQVNFYNQTRAVLRIGANICTPDSTLSGNMPKYWHYNAATEKYYLYKQADVKQRAYNEVFAMNIHIMQRKKVMVDYLPYKIQAYKGQLYSISPNMCDSSIELVHVYDLMQSTKRIDNQTEYVTLKPLLIKLGLTNEYVDDYFDYMLLFDFVISNVDRHMKNIAVMRNTETLQIYAMAPIYDNGDCMYVHGITTVTEETLLRQETSSFYKKAVDNLKLVRNREALRLELLPDCNIIDTIYADILNEEQRARLKRIYQLKVHYLHRFQGGENIWNLIR